MEPAFLPHFRYKNSSWRAILRAIWHSFLLFILLCTGCLPPALPRIIKIGLVAPFEGQHRDIGYDAIYAARLAVREINAAGGVAGWNLELVAYDDRADPDMAQAAARNIAVDPDVVAVIGHYRQTSTEAAADIYREAGVPLIVVGGWLTPTNAPVWHLMPPPEEVASAMVAVTHTLDPSTVAVWGNGPLSDALETAIATYGYQRVPANSLEEATVLPDVIFSTLPPVETATRITEWRAAGWEGTLTGDLNLAAASFARIAGTASQNTYFVAPYPFPKDVPDLAAWTTAYRAVGPHVPEPGLYALPTYEAVYVLAEAIAAAVRAGGASRPQVASMLPAIQRSGYLGEIAWDAAGYWRGPALYAYAWQDSSIRLVERVETDD